MSNLIKTISIGSLLPEEDEVIKYNFFIPKYQRGYRWKDSQIKQLLDDLKEFKFSPDDEEAFYCLQPLVVKKDGDSWIVIDGQQRLTSIFIILTCIERKLYKEKIPLFKLNYENIDYLWDCLDSLGNQDIVEVDESNINKYHVTNAYHAVEEWFNSYPKKELPNIGGELYTKITKRTKFIWYEIDSQSEPEEIFTDINMGKIKLTNAELIKALLLKKDNYGKNDDVATSQANISNAWDSFEAALGKNDFWLFLTNDSYYKTATRMELVFEIMVSDILNENPDFYKENEREYNKDTYTYIIFNRQLSKLIEQSKNKNKEKYSYATVLDDFWREISSYYNMLNDWYENREWYHLIGYLLTINSKSNKDYTSNDLIEQIPEFIKYAQIYRNSTKDTFISALKKFVYKSIKSDFDVEKDDLSIKMDDIKDCAVKLNYKKNDDEIRKFLLLFNVITTQNSDDGSEPRFSFKNFKKQKWDIEHIHAQQTDKPQDSVNRRNWLERFNEHVENFGDCSSEITDEINKLLSDEKYLKDENRAEFENLFDKIVKLYGGDELDTEVLKNDISNLTLLDEKTNRSYKNAVFPVKRDVILSKSGRDDFIPVCTKNVFLKAYSKNVKQLYVWGLADRENYLDSMCSMIANYLNEEN